MYCTSVRLKGLRWKGGVLLLPPSSRGDMSVPQIAGDVCALEDCCEPVVPVRDRTANTETNTSQQQACLKVMFSLVLLILVSYSVLCTVCAAYSAMLHL